MVKASNSGQLCGTPSSWLAKLNSLIGLDHAIAFTVLARGWSALAGVVTVLLIARFLTPSEQGYYYTFFSMVALQVVFELGFSFVVLQMAAHERAQLAFAPEGRVEGNSVARTRLASVLQKSVRWYSVAAVLMAATLVPAGLRFFGGQQHQGEAVSWKGPWSLLVVVAALTFQLDPVFSFLEGCGFVSEIARMRLGQAVLGSALAWAAMVTHHGLFSPAMLILGNAAVQLSFLSKPKFRRLLSALLRHRVGTESVGWRHEIWPFQWRIAITWLCSYCISQLINPILFTYQGPVAAGRMGMSLSIASSIGAVGLAWMSTKASPFGNLIARGETATLDGLFFRTLWQSTVLVSIAAAGLFLCLVVGAQSFPQLTTRLLPPWALALLLLTTVMNHIFLSEALYLRAHKREPLLLQAVVVATVLGLSTCLLGQRWGANAVAVGYFLFGGVLSLVWGTCTFVGKRREWYGPLTTSESSACLDSQGSA
jgi:uncharacterized membrane protein